MVKSSQSRAMEKDRLQALFWFGLSDLTQTDF